MVVTPPKKKGYTSAMLSITDPKAEATSFIMPAIIALNGSYGKKLLLSC